MALPINIEDLLNKRKFESNRIEFKAGWNPDKIYHTICAFATDLENIGGGYILVGVEEENGIAKRPVKGLTENEMDRILKDMVGYDTKISPPYLSKVSPEEVDGKTILVIWVPAGVNRPYSVTESVVAKKSVPKFYIRSKSSTIEAKGEILDEVTSTGQKYVLDNELGRRLGQMSVQVEETVNQCVIIKKVELEQILGQMFVQVWEKSHSKDNIKKLISDTIDLLCLLKENSLSANSLNENLSFDSTKELKRKIILPLIKLGYVSMTYPDKPTSAKQTYKLTEKGKTLF